MAGPGEWLRTLGRALGLVAGEPTPATGAPPATPTDLEPMAATTVAALRATLDEHDRGVFLRSGLLAQLITRDADLFGALLQRLLRLQSHPLVVTAASEDTRAVAHADRLRSRWRKAVSLAAEHDLAASLVLLGFGVGQLLWSWDDELRELVPTLDPWPSECVEYDRHDRQWYVSTRDQGRLAITPGDGQWVLLASRSVHRPHLWGAIRPTAEWYLRGSHNANDASRRAEVAGTPVWAAYLPAGARQTPDGKAFVRSLRTMGRNAAIPLPRGANDASSYDVKLLEAQVDAFKIFEWLQRCGGGKIRLAILGQDLTSQNNLVGTNASSDNGESITATVVEADARSVSATYANQIAAPWTRYRVGDVKLTPGVAIDAEPEEDREADARAMSATAEAAAKWRDLGVEVDLDALAAKARVPTRARARTE